MVFALLLETRSLCSEVAAKVGSFEAAVYFQCVISNSLRYAHSAEARFEVQRRSGEFVQGFKDRGDVPLIGLETGP